MLKFTYIVLLHNNESNILDLVNSLKKVNGNFHKEYIFVDDGSTDTSLHRLKMAVNDLPRTTIITQDNQGPSISINKASNLSSGDYIHFVEGCEVLHPASTTLLLESCLNLGTQVALGMVSYNTLNEDPITSKGQLIEQPIQNILLQKSPDIGRIGKSGTLVSRDLMEKIGKADSDIYSHHMSLSLRCAKNSKFSYIPAYISYANNINNSEDKNFIAYNNLKSIYNFATYNKEFFAQLLPQLLKFLSYHIISKSDKFAYMVQALTSQYLNTSTLENVLNSYKKEIDKLF
jgi:glycosyltransferase involved in cell wall biosynthesis